MAPADDRAARRIHRDARLAAVDVGLGELARAAEEGRSRLLDGRLDPPGGAVEAAPDGYRGAVWGDRDVGLPGRVRPGAREVLCRSEVAASGPDRIADKGVRAVELLPHDHDVASAVDGEPGVEGVVGVGRQLLLDPERAAGWAERRSDLRRAETARRPIHLGPDRDDVARVVDADVAGLDVSVDRRRDVPRRQPRRRRRGARRAGQRQDGGEQDEAADHRPTLRKPWRRRQSGRTARCRRSVWSAIRRPGRPSRVAGRGPCAWSA